MGNAYQHQAVLYNVESSWAEDSQTFGTRLLPVSNVDVSGLTQDLIRPGIMKQRPHEAIEGIRGTQSGSITLDFLLTGHGGTAAGAMSATDLAVFLSHVIGNVENSNVGTTCDTGGTASAPELVAGTFANGSMCRIGAFGDGRGEGQFYLVDNLSGTTLTLKNALGGSPNAADVAFGSLVLSPSETAGTFETVQSLRFRVLSANGQFDCHGCYPTDISFSGMNAGEVPSVSVTFGVSWWVPQNTTFPSATSTDAKAGAPVAAGSLHLGPVGTATRAAYNYRSWSLSINHTVTPITGPTGVKDNQVIVGAKRMMSQASVSFTFDKEATGTQAWSDLWNTASASRNAQLGVITLSSADGRAIGFAFPNMMIDGNRPTQEDVDGLNRVTVNFTATTAGSTGDTDLEEANWKLALG